MDTELVRLLVEDGTRLGAVVALAYLVFKVSGQAFTAAADQYKRAAETAQEELKEFRERSMKDRQEQQDYFENRISDLEARIVDLSTQLGQCRAENLEARRREAELSVRLTRLEAVTSGEIPIQEGDPNG